MRGGRVTKGVRSSLANRGVSKETRNQRIDLTNANSFSTGGNQECVLADFILKLSAALANPFSKRIACWVAVWNHALFIAFSSYLQDLAPLVDVFKV
jgi:hypothetical protein